ncbi:hypothetical protein ORV05_16530 [Amycolatopsis cynarae]|uniref:Uncharacterized protein n=1 Tax=Amycolatopsis cynarae TaxID=2995223 RepID=A0ABY7BBF3_9PSEU|nr:hypothetical protein [Amycolatopsis sp. HUAS 11-8]WAL69305.1 hypothetical protein ORV05_16530 [Amycolatopsis sp. HUAS 11-8]
MNDKEEKHHGWAPDVGHGSEDAQEARRKAMDTPSEEKGEGREVSEEERRGVGSAETEPGSPAGAGESVTRRPEDRGGEKGTEGTKGPAQRPYGRTESDTGVGEEGKATEGPDLPSGDQGG